MGIQTDDSLEIFVDGQYIMLKKYEPACIFCGSNDEIVQVKGKNICGKCIADMKKL